MAVVVVVASFAAYEAYLPRGASPSCAVIQGSSPVRTQAAELKLGAVTEYKLPGLDRWPNAVANASDGTVWFAEQAVPGVGHLYPSNGTVVEYPWPNYPAPLLPDCIPSVSSTGIAIWQGRVWASDQFGSLIQGVNPGDGTVVTLNVTAKAPDPYWLAVGPDGDLWFTSYNIPPAPGGLGRIAPNMTVEAVRLSGLGPYEPLQIEFVNSTLAYIATINLSTNSTTHSCNCNGHIYSFDPSSVTSEVTPTLVGGNFRIVEPTSVTYSDGAVWVTQHDASSIQMYNLSSMTWTTYPTSVMPWLGVTLPYVVESANGSIWFNEHYANKIALLNPASGTLTEYSESNPPASNYSEIQNDESISLGDGGLWFTSMTGNYVGFVNESYTPGFEVAVSGASRGTVAPGGNVSFSLVISGSRPVPMSVSVSDSETYTSVPAAIRVVPSVSTVPAGSSQYSLGVNVGVGANVSPGRYTVLITVTDGLTQESSYVFVTVT